MISISPKGEKSNAKKYEKILFLSFYSAAVTLNYAFFCQDHIHGDIVGLPVCKLLFYAVLRSKRYLEKAFLPVFSEVFIIVAAAVPHPILHC